MQILFVYQKMYFKSLILFLLSTNLNQFGSLFYCIHPFFVPCILNPNKQHTQIEKQTFPCNIIHPLYIHQILYCLFIIESITIINLVNHWRGEILYHVLNLNYSINSQFLYLQRFHFYHGNKGFEILQLMVYKENSTDACSLFVFKKHDYKTVEFSKIKYQIDSN